MTRQPAYILQANIRSYERALADPSTSRLMREVIAELLVETQQRLDALMNAEHHEAGKTLH